MKEPVFPAVEETEAVERKARLSVPPGAKLTSFRMVSLGRLRVTYRYHGLSRTNTIEVAL